MTTQVNGKIKRKLDAPRGRLAEALSAGSQAGMTAASDVRDAAAATAATAASVAPEIAAATGQAVAVAMRRIDRGSDEVLLAGTALTMGLALGLLMAGSNRYLAVMALVPATAMGLTLLERRANLTPRARAA